MDQSFLDDRRGRRRRAGSGAGARSWPRTTARCSPRPRRAWSGSPGRSRARRRPGAGPRAVRASTCGPRGGAAASATPCCGEAIGDRAAYLWVLASNSARSRSTSGRASASTAPRTSTTRASTSGWCGPDLTRHPAASPRPSHRPHPQEHPCSASPDRPEPSAGSSPAPSPPTPRAVPPRRARPRTRAPQVGAEVRGLRVRRRGGRRRRPHGRHDAADGLGRARPATGASSTALHPGRGPRRRVARRLHVVLAARTPRRPSRSGATTTTPSRRSARAGWTSRSCATTSTSTCCRSSPTPRRDPRAGRRGPGRRGRPRRRRRRRPDRAARPGRARRRDVHPHRAGGAHDGRGRRPRGAVLGRELRFEDETVEEAYASRAAAYDVERWQLDAWVSTYTRSRTAPAPTVTDDVPRLTGHPPRTLEDALGWRVPRTARSARPTVPPTARSAP